MNARDWSALIFKGTLFVSFFEQTEDGSETLRRLGTSENSAFVSASVRDRLRGVTCNVTELRAMLRPQFGQR